MVTQDTALAYALARIGMGINLAIHGVVRIPKLNSFAEWMTHSFEKTWLPSPLVHSFAYILPFLELTIGLLLLLGFLTRYALVAGSITLITLIFGSCLIENWSAAGTQMIYLAYLATLLALREKFNLIATDRILA